MATIATLERLPASSLSKLVLTHASSSPDESPLAIIDVRDDGTFSLITISLNYKMDLTLQYRSRRRPYPRLSPRPLFDTRLQNPRAGAQTRRQGDRSFPLRTITTTRGDCYVTLS